MKFRIELADFKNLDGHVDHVARTFAELGFENKPVHPFPVSKARSRSELVETRSKRWSNKPLSADWEIVWHSIVNEKIVGHLNLYLKNLETQLHRIHLGLAIEKGYRGIGIGKALMATAVEWARLQKQLEYIDLTVFASNAPAIQLYKNFGFKEVGRINDAFRVEGFVADDVLMSLKL